MIVPWVRVPHLASHRLARMSAQLSDQWQKVYAHPRDAETAAVTYSVLGASVVTATANQFGRDEVEHFSRGPVDNDVVLDEEDVGVVTYRGDEGRRRGLR